MNRIALGVIPLAISVACYWALLLAAEGDTRRDHKPDGVTVKQAENPFGPYEFLIGEWDVKSEIEGSPIGVQRVRWGPNRSYIWYAVALLSDGREEPHLEGMLVWNGVHKNLDMLFVMDLKSGRVQEQGIIVRLEIRASSFRGAKAPRSQFVPDCPEIVKDRSE